MGENVKLTSNSPWTPVHFRDAYNDIRIVCSGGDVHYMSAAVFASMCKFLQKDLHTLQIDMDIKVLLCDIDHKTVGTFCQLASSGKAYVDNMMTVEAVDYLLKFFTGSNTKLDIESVPITEIKKELNYDEDEIVEQDPPYETRYGNGYSNGNMGMNNAEMKPPQLENDSDDSIPLSTKQNKKTKKKKSVAIKTEEEAVDVTAYLDEFEDDNHFDDDYNDEDYQFGSSALKTEDEDYEEDMNEEDYENKKPRKTGIKRKRPTGMKYKTKKKKVKKEPDNEEDEDKVDPEFEEKLKLVIKDGLTKCSKGLNKKRALSFMCDHCGKKIRGLYKSLVHLREHIGLKALECNLCKKVLDTKDKFSDHYNSAHRKGTCHVCGMQFSTAASLRTHIRNQHIRQEDPFKCDKCDSTFKTKGNLDQHRVRHFEERSFSCHYCGRAFKGKGDCNMHILNIHEPHKLKHECEFCHKKFVSPFMLITHRRGHTGEKPYPCDFCEKSFFSNNHKLSHIRDVHEKKPKIICTECGGQFTSFGNFFRHAVVHTDMTPFKCPLCPMTFKYSEGARRHRIKEHPGSKDIIKGLTEPQKEILMAFHKPIEGDVKPESNEVAQVATSQ